jgi:mRNA interferase RelE/StbE
MFEIFLSRQAKKFLESLDEESRVRIKEKLMTLKENPFSIPYRKIKGRNSTYRIRIGDFRVIYSVRESEIRILKIDRRERIYDRL